MIDCTAAPAPAPESPVAQWTVEAIAARRATGDKLVSAPGWFVCYAGGSSAGDAPVRLMIDRGPAAPGPRDRDVFASTFEAECHALNAGALLWYRDCRAGASS